MKAVRGRMVSFAGDPATDPGALRYWPDGLMTIEHGRIAAIDDAARLLPQLPSGLRIEHHGDALIMPGFIDTHIHFAQTRVIASYGAQLLDWLNDYTFVAEQRFADPGFAAAQARFFVGELLRNGTTTAVAYCSVHPQSVDAFFAESERRGTLMLAGKVLMDRNAPAPLLDTAQRGYDESRALIARWHGRGRQRYVVTPRFAVTSTEAQLQAAGALIAETPDVYVQSHMNENRDEIALALRLYPGAASYADIYRRYGILGPRTILGHCIHMTEAECQLLADTGTVAAFCPTSNLFLGSGLLDRHNLREARRPVRLAYATDVGGGTSYSMLATLAEAYKVSQLQGQKLPAAQGFHGITRGNAEALGLAHEIGSLEPGRAADLVVLDTRATPAMRQRMAAVAPDRLDEELFVLMIMGDDRAVRATYVQGERVTLDG